MKRLLLPILLTSQATASALFDEYTPKFTNKRTSDARIGLLEEIDPHTVELTEILSHSDFSEFLSALGESDYCKVSPQKLRFLNKDINKIAKKLFITNWTQSGNAIYPPDRAMATLRAIKSDLLVLERQLPRLSAQSGLMMVQKTPIKGDMSLQEKMAYIFDQKNTAHDILFRLLYKFKLVQRIVLRFSGDLPVQTKTRTPKRKDPPKDPDESASGKKRFSIIPSDKLPIPQQ